MMQTTTEQLLKPFTNSLGRIQKYRYETELQRLSREEIERRTSFMNDAYTFRDRCHALVKDIDAAPVCCCGAPLHYVQHRNDFSLYCSLVCMNSSAPIRETRRKSRIKQSERDYESLNFLTEEFFTENFVKPKLTVAEFQEKYDIKNTVLLRRKMQEQGVEPNTDKYSSSHENRVFEWFPEATRNTRKFIAPKEVDLLFENEKIAVEINGIYWHSEARGCGKSYHLNKRDACEEKGFRLLQFWHTQVEEKPEIVKSIIASALGKNTKIGARKCSIYKPTKQEEREFFDRNHLQGFIGSSDCIALKYGDEIVSMISFKKPRYSKDEAMEVLRFCHKLGHNVVGGLSRLIKASEHDKLITYADKMWATGYGYIAAGFVFDSETKPSYYYTKNYHFLQHRTSFQKHMLESKLEKFDPNLTEWENMKANGWDRVWDCGTRKLRWSRDK